MRLTFQLLLAMALLPAAAIGAAHAQGAPAGPIYIATYVEVGERIGQGCRQAARAVS